MPTIYRFKCYEDADPTYPASLVADHTSGKIAYFDSHYRELTCDIAMIGATAFTVDGEPLMGLRFGFQKDQSTSYCLLNDFSDALAALQDEVLWHMLCKATRGFPEPYRCV